MESSFSEAMIKKSSLIRLGQCGILLEPVAELDLELSEQSNRPNIIALLLLLHISNRECRILSAPSAAPCPFPSNIMIGFRAEYAAGELRPDGEEVLESRWFDRNALPAIPRKGSIARAMLDDWSTGKI